LGALTAPDLGLPAVVLADFGWWFESPLALSAHRGGVALGPGAFDQRPSGRGGAGCGDGPLAALRTGGRFRGPQAHDCPQGSWMRKTSAIANFSYHGDGHGAWPTAPGWHGIVPFLFETLEACGLLMNRRHRVVPAEGRCRGGTAPLSEPSAGGRAPMGPRGRLRRRS
jgi:hypothetical protein